MSDGVFRPSGATAWSSYNTPRIWAMVAAEDDPESWRQVAALGSMAGLLKDQRQRLERARDALVQSWSPETNASASAFVELIDDLLLNMRRNKEIADQNADALGRILESLRQAKANIEPIYDSYVKKSDDWVPAWWDDAEDELDDKARRRMLDAERLIADPANVITVPPLYQPKVDVTRIRPGSGAGSGAKEPVAVRPAAGFAVPHQPPPPVPGSRDSAPPTGVDGLTPAGPELAAVVPSPTSPPSTGSPPVPAPSVSGGLAGPGLVIGGAPLPSQSTGVRGMGNPRPGGSRTGRPSAGSVPVGGLRAGSGLIGGGPPGGRGGPGTRTGASGRAGVPPAKPATPPWLPPAAGQPASGGRRGSAAPGMPMANGRRSSAEEPDTISCDPDNPWATAEGVDPVIAPGPLHHRHDPGPGVIGWQR